MPANRGVVITGSRHLDKIVSVQEIPYPELDDDWIIIKAYAYAMNPSDWKHIYTEEFISRIAQGLFKKLGFGIGPLANGLGHIGGFIAYHLGKGLTFLQKGNTAGSDVSGIVEDVGKNVTQFKKGDIVASGPHGGVTKNGAYADYVLVSANCTIKFDPSQISTQPLVPGEYPSATISSFEGAASVTLALKTIVPSLYFNLAIPDDKVENQNHYILIWGGATATGFLAIQVAKLVFGLKVLATASKKHHDLLLDLGADKVFDYHDADVVQQIKTAGENKIKYALDTVSTSSTLQSVYDATEGSDIAVIDNLLLLNEEAVHRNPERKVKFTSPNSYSVDGKTHFGVRATQDFLDKFNEFWEKYIPTLAKTIRTAPLQVLPPGFESAKTGLHLMIENKVSGHKLVFRNKDV